MAPSLTCANVPACTTAGATAQLDGACSADNSLGQVDIAYLLNGQVVTSATCPAVGTPLAVTVRLTLRKTPACSYNVTGALTLNSERAGGSSRPLLLAWHGMSWGAAG